MYIYLDLVLHEHFSFKETMKAVAQSDSRVLGFHIVLPESVGSTPYDVFTRLQDAIVWPTISYGAVIWGS